MRGKTDNIDNMDLNHAMKSYRSQTVLGSTTKKIGGIIIDQVLFQVTNDPMLQEWHKLLIMTHMSMY